MRTNFSFLKETDFKGTPIGMIPMGWKVARLADESIAKIRGNKTTNKFERVAFIPMELVPDSGVFARYEICPMKDVKSFTYCESGDLLLAKITPSLENGKQGIVPDYIPNGFGLATTEVFPISCKNIDRLFLFYLLKFPQHRNKIISSMIGTTGRQRASKKSIENLLIPFPSLPEQQKIAEVLFAVDEAIQKTNEVIAKTERLKKGLMQELLTKGIGHKEFRDTEIGRIPKEWEVPTLREVGRFQYGFTTSAEKEETGVKLLRITDIKNDGIEWGAVPYCKVGEAELEKHKLEAGDVLFARIGATTGKTCYVDQPVKGVFGSYLIRFEPTDPNIDTKFLYFYTQSDMYWRQVNRKKEGQLKKGLNTKTLGSLLLPLPPLAEQQKIGQILSTVDKKLELERNEKVKLEKIKQGMMNLLLTGKVRVEVK